MKRRPKISRLRELLSYDPLAGKISWRINRYGYRNSLAAKAGDVAGSLFSNGYRYVAIGKNRQLSHRIAWAMYYGRWPKGDIDHINMDRLDNRIVNLRIATRAQNMSNRSHTKGNTLKAKGVELTRTGRYAVKISKDYKRYHVGTFDTVAQAIDAYATKAKELHKEFARS